MNSPARWILRGTLAVLLLLLIGELPSWSVIASLLFLLLGFFSLKVPRFRIPRFVVSTAAVLSGLVVYWQFRTLIGRESSATLLALLASLKALESTERSDERTGALIGLFLVAVVFLFYFDLWVCLLAGLAALLLLWQFFGGTQDPRWNRRTFRTILQLSLLSLPSTIILFLVVPRLQHEGGLWNAGPVSSRTGFKEEVDPSSAVSVEDDATPVFRAVWSPMSPPGPIYWRGGVLQDVTGFIWRAGRELPEPPEMPATESPLHVSWLLEPQKGPWTFAPEGTQTLNANGTRIFRRESQGSWVFGTIPQRRVQLEASVSRRRDRPARLSGEQRERLLKRPPVSTVVREWLQQAVSPTADTSELKVRAILSAWRQQGFVYSRQPGRITGLEGFLKIKKGLCEHYSSALALLLRELGIPARVVVGYLGGVANPFGGFLQINESDAHAWVEYLDEENRWQTADGTSAVRPEDPLADRFRSGSLDLEKASLWEKIRWSADNLNYQWILFFMRFDLEAQKDLVSQLSRRNTLPVVLAPILLMLMTAAIWAYRQRGRWQDGVDSLAVQNYRALLKSAQEQALALPPQAGPEELRQALEKNPGENWEQQRQIIQDYVEERFANSSRVPAAKNQGT